MMIIITIVFVFLSAYIDYEHLRDNDYIESHVSRWILRALFVLAVAQGDFIVMAGMTLLFTALFDAVLNKLTKMPLLYLGSTARWDRFFTSPISFKLFKKKFYYKNKMLLYIVVKIISLFLGVYLLLI